jgi:hypothetical protein
MKACTRRSTATVHRQHANETRKGILFFILFTLIAAYSFSQTGSYLDFRNPSQESGTPGADGAQYRFSGVTTNVDAIVTIIGRSDALVNLLNPDMNTSGFDGAFQPQVGYNNGTTPGAADWWMEFNIQFVAQATLNPVVLGDFNVSGVDIDGNGQYINEYLAFFDMQDYSLESGSGLTITSLNENINGSMLAGKRFDGPVANYTNIDTSATMVMVTNHYVNKSSFTVRTGGRSTDVSGASDRMYSFYFQNFIYTSPSNGILSLRNRVTPEKKKAVDHLITAYPNPVVSSLNISVTNGSDDNYSLTLYDIHGRVCATKLVNNKGLFQLDMSTVKPGVYMVQAKNGSNKFVERIVKL